MAHEVHVGVHHPAPGAGPEGDRGVVAVHRDGVLNDLHLAPAQRPEHGARPLGQLGVGVVVPFTAVAKGQLHGLAVTGDEPERFVEGLVVDGPVQGVDQLLEALCVGQDQGVGGGGEPSDDDGDGGDVEGDAAHGPTGCMDPANARMAAGSTDPRPVDRLPLTFCHRASGSGRQDGGRCWYRLGAVLPRIAEAPLHAKGFYEARPGDVAGRDDLFMLDVRYEADLSRDMGHIHQVHHLPLAELDRLDLPLDTPVVTLCGNGFESRRAAVQLVAAGYREVYHLVGGMIRWHAEERPVARVATWRAAPRRP